jgi:hypothetical protein
VVSVGDLSRYQIETSDLDQSSGHLHARRAA